MKKLVMLFAIVATQTMAFEKEIDNLTVTVKPNTVEVYRGSRHLFSQDCRDFSCKILTTRVNNPLLQIEDGWVKLNHDVREVTEDSIVPFKPFHWNDHNYVSFIVSQASVSGTQNSTTQYLINAVNGSVQVNKNESDFYRNGLPYNVKF